MIFRLSELVSCGVGASRRTQNFPGVEIYPPGIWQGAGSRPEWDKWRGALKEELALFGIREYRGQKSVPARDF